MLSQKFINEQKKNLEQKKGELEEQLKSIINKDRQSSEYDATFPHFGDKDDENAAEVAAYQGNLSLEENLKFSVERINNALDRIKNNTYGVCDKCSSEINPQRLVAFPQATTCMKCKKKVV